MGTKRVVVMGATGFIGTYLVENLLGQNYSVTILVRHKARVSSHAWKGKVSILEWDGADPKALKVQETGYDTFFLRHGTVLRQSIKMMWGYRCGILHMR